MKTKLTTLAFGLLLAVGWTNYAQAQEVTRGMSSKYATSQMRKTHSQKEAIGQPGVNETTVTLVNQGSQFRAPLRSQNFSQTSPVVHPKSWYQALDPVTWDGGSQNITEPFTDVDGMMALVKRVYTDRGIPGFKFSEPLNLDIPYQSIQHGWNIIYNQYEDIELFFGSGYIDIAAIRIVSGTDTTIWAPTSTTTSLPNGWTTDGNLYFESMSSYGYNGLYAAYLASGGSIYIPASQLANSNGYVSVDVASIFVGPSQVTNFNYTVHVIANDTYPYVVDSIRSDGIYWYTKFNCAGTTTPPDDAGYTVMLVKVQDDFDQNNVPEYTYSTQELRNYFQTYVKEIQLLTDGLRVQEGTEDAGTLFAYRGDLNKFYFIGKGKMAFKHSIESEPFDRAPFYSMYEEFSPYVSGEHEDHSDFYEKMKQGTTYPVVHDCEGVICLEHYFAMTGQESSTESRVNCLVFYVPDNRGEYGGWQTYELEHQPTVGMYMIDLYADIEPSATQTDYYTVTVDWYDNLDVITHSDGIPQTYTLYQIMDEDNDGDMDTTVVYTGPNTTWSFDYPVGDPSAYGISYYVIGTPSDATNKDTFFAKSNTDDVTVPGNSDFIGLQWWRYESDYVTNDGTNQEVNYYRNWLAPHKLSTQGQAGISAGNVGTTGRTLTLYREDTPIIDLELVMSGNKAYYRIKYRNRNENQQVEPGYDPNTGELNTNN